MRIAIAVQGRFHAFDLARAMLEGGDDVTLLTTYPGWAVQRFGFPKDRATSLAALGILQKVADRVNRIAPVPGYDRLEHRWFGHWVARSIALGDYDLVHSWSGVAEEMLVKRSSHGLYTIMRGSAHILDQHELLASEARRVGCDVTVPGRWIISRELREYDLVDKLVVLSSFARDSFLRRGHKPEKVVMIPLATRAPAFVADQGVAEGRAERIRRGDKLRVLFVGSRSAQKGMHDLVEVVERLGHKDFDFRLVGGVAKDFRHQARSIPTWVDQVGHVPQSALLQHYAWADVFYFPTIQDGFATVLAQAVSARVPVLSTPNSAWPDLHAAGSPGWIVPIRDPEAHAARLRWCADSREQLAQMVLGAGSAKLRGWRDVADDFKRLVESSGT